MSENRLRLCSLNSRGLNKAKLSVIFDYIQFQQIDVCFLQETHINSKEDLLEIESEAKLYNYSSFFTINHDKTKGVGFFIKSIYCMHANMNLLFNQSRIISVDIHFKTEIIKLINVYAPNAHKDQFCFIEELFKLIPSTHSRMIVAGDFNFNFHDSKNEKLSIRVQWMKFRNLYNLYEVRMRAGMDSKTWRSGMNSSHIDYFFVSKNLNASCEFLNNQTNSISDHNFISFQCVLLNKAHNRSNYMKHNEWKLNESVLCDEYVDNYIKNKCVYIGEMRKKHGYDWYEIFIADIIKMLKRESRKISEKQKSEIKNLYLLLNQNSMIANKNENDEMRKIEIESEIDKYYNNKRIGLEKRAREEKKNFVFQPSKILIEREVRNARANTIYKYECADKSVTSDNDIILSEIETYYKNLMGRERVKKEKINNYNFHIKKLDNSLTNVINYKITYEEANSVVERMKSSAPGPNGLTVGFFKKYFHLFGEYFVEILNNTSSPLSGTFTQSCIKLIPKNTNSTKSINDLRPITLTNLEYRIFTKILANRVRSISFLLIEENQTCSVQGRRMNDNIVMLRDMILDAKLRRKNLNVVSCDQKKAFDSISHDYIFSILEHINVGSFIIENIKRLYFNSCASIIINGYKTNDIYIKSGIKQGCALSMMLYIIAIDELIVRIKKNENIKGYKISVVSNYEIKVSAYADDIVGYVVDERSIRAFFAEFDEWGEVSGACLNKEKTKIMRNSSEAERVEMKILGINFDNDGISKKNLKNASEKVEKSLNIWSGVKLSLLEKIIVCKTFILCKIYFYANFIYMEKDYIKQINKKIYRFIWNNNCELVKRDTLILPYEEGGMNMFHLETRIKTILLQQFYYIYMKFDSMFYGLSVYWLKFELRKRLKNFNLVPFGVDKERPPIYKRMIECKKELEELDSEFKSKFKVYTSKQTYAIYRKKVTQMPWCERNERRQDWVGIYKNINHKYLNSELRSFNYRIINNALSLETKININKKCVMCKRANRATRDHIFLNCPKTSELFQWFKDKYKCNVDQDKKGIYYNQDLNFEQNRLVSIYKLAIWKCYCLIKNEEVRNIENSFKKIFYALLKKL